MKKTKANKKSAIFRLALISVFSAIIVAMTFIPYVGYISTGLLSITTVHIIVILGAISVNTYSGGLILGTVWGVSCLLYAMTSGTPDSAIFLDPRISVVPRMLVGLLVVAFYRLALAAQGKKFFNILLKTATTLFASSFASLLCYNIMNRIEFFGATAIWISSVAVGILMAALFIYLFFFFNKSTESMPALFATLCGTFSNTALVLTAINLFGNNGVIELGKTVQLIFSTAVALNGTIEIVAAAIIAVPCGIALQKALSKLK